MSKEIYRPRSEQIAGGPEREPAFVPALMVVWTGIISYEHSDTDETIRLGDKILSIDNRKIAPGEDIASLQPKQLIIERDGKHVKVRIPKEGQADLWKQIVIKEVQIRTVLRGGEKKEQFRIVYDFETLYELPAEVIATFAGMESFQLPPNFAREHDLPQNGTAFRLDEMVIRNKQTGATFDVAKRANAHKYAIQCLRTNYRDPRAYDAADSETKTIIGSVPDLPLTFATLLHELGHADQHERKGWHQEAAELDGIGRRLHKGYLPVITPFDFSKLFLLVPHLAEQISLDELSVFCEEYTHLRRAVQLGEQAIVRASRKEDAASGVYEYMSRFRVSILDESALLKEYDAPELDQIYQERRKRFVREVMEAHSISPDQEQELLDVLALWEEAVRELAPHYQLAKRVFWVVTQMIERDATRRAFRWMRQIRDEIGIDLLKPISLKEKLSDEEVRTKHRIDERPEHRTKAEWEKRKQLYEHKTGMRQVSVGSYLEYALDTYGATTSELRVVEGKVPAPIRAFRPMNSLWAAKEALKQIGRLAIGP